MGSLLNTAPADCALTWPNSGFTAVRRLAQRTAVCLSGRDGQAGGPAFAWAWTGSTGAWVSFPVGGTVGAGRPGRGLGPRVNPVVIGAAQASAGSGGAGCGRRSNSRQCHVTRRRKGQAPSSPADEGLPEFALVHVNVAVKSFDDDKQVVVLRAHKGRSRGSVSTVAALQLSGSVATLAEVRPVIEDEAISTGRDDGVGITRGSLTRPTGPSTILKRPWR
jgi:hypothetical protein